MTAGELQKLGANTKQDALVSVHAEQAAAHPNRQHRLTEDHNADPVCACGWGPEHMWPRENPATREDGRNMVRRHIRANQPNTGHLDGDG